jgi:hypothetical protein
VDAEGDLVVFPAVSVMKYLVETIGIGMTIWLGMWLHAGMEKDGWQELCLVLLLLACIQLWFWYGSYNNATLLVVGRQPVRTRQPWVVVCNEYPAEGRLSFVATRRGVVPELLLVLGTKWRVESSPTVSTVFPTSYGSWHERVVAASIDGDGLRRLFLKRYAEMNLERGQKTLEAGRQ